MIGHSEEEVHEAGLPADAGSFTCVECSLPISLDHSEPIPECPRCGGTRFLRASIFEHEQPTVSGFAIGARLREPADWLEGVRESIEAPGKYLAFYAGGHPRVIELEQGWSRIGRSSSADIRLDDPTVSRRHAVVVRTPEGTLKALDDRSTNGLVVNGDKVDWAPIGDRDELQVGRYTLHVIETAGSPPGPAGHRSDRLTGS